MTTGHCIKIRGRGDEPGTVVKTAHAAALDGWEENKKIP